MASSFIIGTNETNYTYQVKGNTKINTLQSPSLLSLFNKEKQSKLGYKLLENGGYQDLNANLYDILVFIRMLGYYQSKTLSF